MMLKHLAALVTATVTTLALLPSSPIAFAADKIETSLLTKAADGTATNVLSFDFAACEEECHFASLTCDADGRISLELADVPTPDVIKAMQRVQHQIVLKANGKIFDFNIEKMSFAELTGAWWVDAQLFATDGETFPQALAKAKTIDFKLAKQPTRLTVDQNVGNWAKACK